MQLHVTPKHQLQELEVYSNGPIDAINRNHNNIPMCLCFFKMEEDFPCIMPRFKVNEKYFYFSKTG
jgi:hypothetical protein